MFGQDGQRGSLMVTEDFLLWGAVLCLGFIAGAAIYFERASFRRSKGLSASHGFGRRSRPHHPKSELKREAKGKTP
ncbi:hypothetical protein EOA27_04910 [Mesorhizobium sp. M2A.F.Ca.ET.037.01.1.1]|uniref:hypothetical protein n=2 Tax=Mesorhizobium TaxID=68287 RepID=UPI000F76102A|nr:MULTISPECIES: hypothetical protein [unclassified Mesorhizobium]RUY08780.1 hypothetical protein EOA25_13155 [Mesorhizobium sp. M2A.F.Ca.ET.040.01.1.1]RVC69277.1 hypothetical protein EN759_08600 [Mesorhizobium sp. M00.F.Ca.ET.038.03.1.1]RVC82110.1 hypothetical protein EN766_01745 [Mesorhizobium sp. M2A.F.Ca.ET.046.02.1.1]AZO05449.1 hypothetical protein EJ068_22050 [Mesorhizobium sp. M2A.F.Ca.ET.043.02.1.1]AZO34434.1 hypothetical protein EJ072_08200 [Mesorhizobium sp. M2A.F.Ca.ET.046.03.2.1]